MRVLVIDTSSAAVTAAVVEVDVERVGRTQLLDSRVVVDGRAHGELLAGLVQAALAGSATTARELGAIVVGAGPGPFTGLRVGLVTAAAMADALGVAVHTVCSLDGLCHAPTAGELLVATDARRKEVYWARYRGTRRLAGPDVARPADLDTTGMTAMTGAGARLYRDALGLPLLDVDFPDPVGLARVAADRIAAGAPSDPLTPLYLRRPDAMPPALAKAVSQP